MKHVFGNKMESLPDFIKKTAELIRESHRQIDGRKFLDEYYALLDGLFPGGYDKTFEKIRASDGSAIEFGLIFIEVRPYFFRSQYIRTQLIRTLKHSKLSALQSERFQKIIREEHEKKMKRKKSF